MKCSRPLPRFREGLLQNFVLLHLTVRDRLVDPRQVLINNPARAQVKMADLGISHLARGQTDVFSARAQGRAGIFAIEPIVKWRRGQQSRVAVLLPLRFSPGLIPHPSRITKTTGLGHRPQSPDARPLPQAVSRSCGIDNACALRSIDGMKWRNQLLALFCLALFVAFGVLYFRHWVVQKPFGIILFVGEGLTPDRIAATRLYTGGANVHLAIESSRPSRCSRIFPRTSPCPTTRPRPLPWLRA